ncbi:His/Gly/Thr/Pro-type tRNA ligase C-terminal domain-containing protein [bacterium]|nr:His/Gly/Thr/Pro-type tRNA ligase C-terminal domain-containing protein [bacterium]
MRQSQLFTKTRKEAPTDEVSKNAQLLIRAGYIHKEMAGVYAFLPLGLRVLEKIKNIVREEMNAIGGQELLMTSLQRKELWEKTDRWDDEKVDVWFKSAFKNGAMVGFGWSHEEQITEMMTNYISSYRDLPVSVYQFQTKLRNETRAKSGLMRCREFVMKDLYSYSQSEEAHKTIYDGVTAAYYRVFEKIGLGEKTFFTFASGGAFTKFSHEFQTLIDAGEDTIYVHREKKIAINQEVLTDEVMRELGVTRDELDEVKSAEVGNIFSFGGTKSEQLGLYFKDEEGNTKPVILGSYGIGITRLMGVIVEILADEKGIVWPESVAPFKFHLVALKAKEEGDKLYEKLTKQGIEVLYDDREEASAGEKFADADLLGLPYRVVISEKTLKENTLELKNRKTGEVSMVGEEEVIEQGLWTNS